MRRTVVALGLMFVFFFGVVPVRPARADTYEPNDSLASATSISVGYAYSSYISSSSDVDYFRLAPSSSGTLTVSLSVPASVDYDIQLQDASGSTLSGGYNGTGSNESFTYNVTGGTTYYLRIYSYSGYSTSSAYTLSTSLSGGSTTDPYEPNDSTSAAYGVSAGTTYTSKISGSTDVDYYTFVPSTNSTFSFSMTVPGDKDYDVQLLDSGGNTVTGSYGGTGSSESMTATLSASSRYYIKVYGYNGAYSTTASYSFNFTLTTTVSDPYEPNDSTSAAYGVSAGTTYTSKISSSTDVDYYTFIPSTNSTFSFSMTVPGDKDYDVQLLDSGGNTVTGSYGGTGSSESMTATLNANSRYYIKVYGYNGAYSTTASYSFSYTLASAGDPFFNSIPATPPDLTSWINSFNNAIWERWTYSDGTRIKGNFYSLYDSTRQVGCSPVEFPDIDCYDALKFTTAKLDRLWSEALSRGQDPRFYLAILRHEGTGSFNSKPPEGDQNCGGNCADVDFDRDLSRVGTRLVPQKVRGYTLANGFRQAWPNEDLFPYIGWWTPIDRNGGESGVYATHFTWYQGIQSIYNDLSGNQSQEYTQYVLRQYQAGNPEFTPVEIRTTATWNSNVDGGTAGTPAPGFVYHSDPAGTQPMTPPANTMWWVTNNTGALPAQPVALKDVVALPRLASTAQPGLAMGTFSNHLFSLQLPAGWSVQSTLSGDQWLFHGGGKESPVVRVFILPGLRSQQGKAQFENRWQFRGKPIASGTTQNATNFRADGPDSFFTGHWSASVGMETREGYVKILHVTVPDSQRAEWEPVIQRIIQSFAPTAGVYK